ncbi:pyrroline-5-carboxylate reductase [Rhodoplanes sp. Z2-YC6860]|uniref:pyrroline-5-carboxylate reductase n=1 Tax=Rhodoplanes sp. Z2-YC6860 TaxID=674703 RepID=UPI00078E50BB|nr:pyrroline-5-carboxylate reductase [Rhodoplanes sp. Z2-YC6860]AMN39937.1 pyrroline-5-carboxylate reductase [Rhodoplanes sp. Z2-YC6860]
MPKLPTPNSLASIPGTLVLVGAGKMGGAMLDGWLARKLPPKKVVIIDPQPSKQIKALARRGVRINPKDAIANVAAMVLAVKPQTAPDVLPTLASLAGPKTVVVSIMAGRPLGFLEKHFGTSAVVRAMPNTPAAIGRGITVAVGNAKVKAPAKKLAHGLLAATGSVEWVDDEALMDAVTAVSGSGPAYVFLLAEAMAQAGLAAGLPKELAEKLARETVAGSGELLHRSPLPAATLRQNVTSPGGTTAAALDVLMSADGVPPLMTKAIAAATRRGKELAG